MRYTQSKYVSSFYDIKFIVYNVTRFEILSIRNWVKIFYHLHNIYFILIIELQMLLNKIINVARMISFINFHANSSNKV